MQVQQGFIYSDESYVVDDISAGNPNAATLPLSSIPSETMFLSEVDEWVLTVRVRPLLALALHLVVGLLYVAVGSTCLGTCTCRERCDVVVGSFATLLWLIKPHRLCASQLQLCVVCNGQGWRAGGDQHGQAGRVGARG